MEAKEELWRVRRKVRNLSFGSSFPLETQSGFSHKFEKSKANLDYTRLKLSGITIQDILDRKVFKQKYQGSKFTLGYSILFHNFGMPIFRIYYYLHSFSICKLHTGPLFRSRIRVFNNLYFDVDSALLITVSLRWVIWVHIPFLCIDNCKLFVSWEILYMQCGNTV